MGIFDKIIEYVNGAETASASYKPTTPYTGSLPSKTVKKGSKGTDVKHTQKFLNWCIKAGLSVDGSCGKHTVSAIKKYQKQYKLKVDGVFGSQSRNKAKAIVKAHAPTPTPTPAPTPTPTPVGSNGARIVAKATEYCWPYGTSKSKYSYKKGTAKKAYKTALKKYLGLSKKLQRSDCGHFVTTCVRASGISKSFKALKGRKQSFPSVPSTMYIVHKGKKIPSGLLQAGDIIRYKKTNGGQHVLIYYGDGKIAEAGRGSQFPAIEKDTKKYNASNVRKKTLQVIRAK